MRIERTALVGIEHVELGAQLLTYDPAEITLKEILEIFFVIHDPTSLNRQGNDAATPSYEP